MGGCHRIGRYTWRKRNCPAQREPPRRSEVCWFSTQVAGHDEATRVKLRALDTQFRKAPRMSTADLQKDSGLQSSHRQGIVDVVLLEAQRPSGALEVRISMRHCGRSETLSQCEGHGHGRHWSQTRDLHPALSGDCSTV